MAQLMTLPLTVSCFSKIQIGFTFLVPAHLGSPGKGPLNGCVCVLDRGADVQRVSGGRGEPRVPAAQSLSHQRARRAARVLRGRRRLLQLVQLRQTHPLSVVSAGVNSARLPSPAEHRGRQARYGIVVEPTEGLLSAAQQPLETTQVATRDHRFAVYT